MLDGNHLDFVGLLVDYFVSIEKKKSLDYEERNLGV